ncbi:MarR family transcriptional regulator [Cetobacterium sp.]|uniref:MarR family transcriptional regulator n=1 Tax=Cetobacterium sp. TaxID=2071632 RepID=UPI003F3B95FC
MIKLSKSNMRVLEFISENPGLTQLEIVNKIKLSKGSISIFIKNAKKNNLIFEVKVEQKLKIHPTKLGKDIVIKDKLKKILDNLEKKGNQI